jgi:YesN/AraC family two-component response regulator
MKTKSKVVVVKKHRTNFYTALSSREIEVSFVPLSQSLNNTETMHADIVLLDCGYDSGEGLAWFRKFKKLKSDVPVIFITNVKSYDVVKKAYSLGVRDYFAKPVSISELQRLITELLTLKRNSHEKRTALPCTYDEDTFAHDCKMVNAMLSDIPERIVCVVHYIEENLSRTLNLDELAQIAHLSKYYFVKMFKQMTGFSPLEYTTILKIHRAKHLLTEEDIPVSIIAEEVGYRDLRNFDRCFKRHTGYSPVSYRKVFSGNSSLHHTNNKQYLPKKEQSSP